MSLKEMKSKRDNSWRGDDEEVEFTFEELMSDDLDVVVQSSEAAKNNEEYEAMVRELLVHDHDFITFQMHLNVFFRCT